MTSRNIVVSVDELANNLCKPLGCRVVACLGGRRSGDCSS